MERKRFEKAQSILDYSMRIMDEINNQIVDDGIIATDEIDLFNVIHSNIMRYQELLKQILEDGKIEDDEIDQIIEFERKLNNAVQEQAIEDGRISVPEKELINKLFDQLKLIGSLRELDDSRSDA